MAYPRSRRSRAHKFVNYSGGNITLSSGAWANLSTTLDITLSAQPGDTIEASISGLLTAVAENCVFTVATIVSGAVVNVFGAAESVSGMSGFGGWFAPALAQNSQLSGYIMYSLTAADIAAGNVTLRIRYRNSSGATRILVATAADVFHWSAKNLGPPDVT